MFASGSLRGAHRCSYAGITGCKTVPGILPSLTLNSDPLRGRPCEACQEAGREVTALVGGLSCTCAGGEVLLCPHSPRPGAWAPQFVAKARDPCWTSHRLSSKAHPRRLPTCGSDLSVWAPSASQGRHPNPSLTTALPEPSTALSLCLKHALGLRPLPPHIWVEGGAPLPAPTLCTPSWTCPPSRVCTTGSPRPQLQTSRAGA